MTKTLVTMLTQGWLAGLVLLVMTLVVAGGSWHFLRGREVNTASVPSNPPVNDAVLACQGYVTTEHGVIGLYPQQPGQVVRVLAHEGDHVSEGAALLAMDDSSAKLRVDEAKAAVQAVGSQLAAAKELTKQHQSQKQQVQGAVAAARTRITAARHHVERLRKQRDANLVNAEEVLIAEEKVRELEALLQVELGRLAEWESRDPQLAVQRAEAELAVAEVRLRIGQRTLDDCVVRAPQAGLVLRMLAGPGDMLGGMPRQPAVQFCPDGPRFIRAEVEQDFASRLAVGQPVTVYDEADSRLSWPGKVIRVADWYAQRRVVPGETPRLQEVPTLETVIALTSGADGLRINQRVRVIIGPTPAGLSIPDLGSVTKGRGSK